MKLKRTFELGAYSRFFIYKAAVLLTVYLSFSKAYCQTIIINTGRYQVDKTLKLIVCNQIPASLTASAAAIQLDHLYTFESPVSEINPAQFYPVTYNDTTYQLSFTKFPIITIDTKGVSIVQNVARTAFFSLTDSIGTVTASYAGINIRGVISATFPKKSYKVEFWTDTVSQASKDVTLLDMRTDSDWILLAMYNETLRINNVTSHALWRTMHQLYYSSQEPTALSAIRTRYVDVFVNGSYAGIYALGESMDRKQLQLKKTRDNGGVRGELYKASDWTSATIFSAMPAKDGNDTTWAGFELKYPNKPGFWTNLYGLVDSTINWSNTKFVSQIASKWQIDNLVDYFLFINLIRALDNWAKNLYIARYKEGEPYIVIAWDLDGTWGFNTGGGRESEINGILANGFYNRLLSLNPANFKQKLKTRWFSLRANLFAANNLKNRLASNATLLTTNGAYLREATRWPVASVNTELSYINTWIDNRIAFLDNYFNQFPDFCLNSAAPTVGISTSVVTAGKSVTLTANGCAYTVVWNTGQTGNSLVVNPWETAKYWAICNQLGAGCESPTSTTIIATVLPDTNPDRTETDLSLAMISEKLVIPVGSMTSITLAVTNHSPETARSIRLQDRLPANLIFVTSSDSAVTHMDGILSTGFDIININVDSLEAYQTTHYAFKVRPLTDGNFLNSAQILMTATYDPDSTPGSGTGDGEDDMTSIDLRTLGSSTTITESPNPNQRPLPTVVSNQPVPDSAAADLSLKLEAGQRIVRQGDNCSITMVVYNEGGLAATGVTVQCVLPAGLRAIPASGITISENTVSATGLTIAAGNMATVTFQVQVINSGKWTCLGQIMTSEQVDPDSTPGNGATNGEDDEAQIDMRSL